MKNYLHLSTMVDDDSEIIAIESRFMLFGERGSWHERVWDEIHPRLGRDTSVSGSWYERIWGEARLRLLPDTAERGAAFATN